MTKVRITEGFVAPVYGALNVGTEITVMDSYAEAWVKVNRAVLVDAPKPKPKAQTPDNREKAAVQHRFKKIERRG